MKVDELLETSEKNPMKSALGKALWRDLSKVKKASPAQQAKNKERWASIQASVNKTPKISFEQRTPGSWDGMNVMVDGIKKFDAVKTQGPGVWFVYPVDGYKSIAHGSSKSELKALILAYLEKQEVKEGLVIAKKMIAEGRISNFRPPFSVMGNWVNDSKGRGVCEMGESREALKDIADALNAWVKQEVKEGYRYQKRAWVSVIVRTDQSYDPKKLDNLPLEYRAEGWGNDGKGQLVAFASKKDADHFIKKQGGEVVKTFANSTNDILGRQGVKESSDLAKSKIDALSKQGSGKSLDDLDSEYQRNTELARKYTKSKNLEKAKHHHTLAHGILQKIFKHPDYKLKFIDDPRSNDALAMKYDTKFDVQEAAVDDEKYNKVWNDPANKKEYEAYKKKNTPHISYGSWLLQQGKHDVKSVSEAVSKPIPSLVSFIQKKFSRDFSDIADVEDLFDSAYLSDVEIYAIQDAMEEENKPAKKVLGPRVRWVLSNMDSKSRRAYQAKLKPVAQEWIDMVAPLLDAKARS